MNYYQLHFSGVKKADKKAYEHFISTCDDRDVIEWYNDGKNIFFGAAALNEGNVVISILNTIGNININYCMWGI